MDKVFVTDWDDSIKDSNLWVMFLCVTGFCMVYQDFVSVVSTCCVMLYLDASCDKQSTRGQSGLEELASNSSIANSGTLGH